MKKLFLYCCVSAVILSCDFQQKANDVTNEKPTNDNDLLLLSSQLSKQELVKYDFQKISRHIVARPNPAQLGLTNKNEVQKKVFEFYESGGFAPEPTLPVWKQTMTLEQADKNYKSFISKNKQSPLIKSYRQYATQVILQDLALLAKNDSKSIETIAFYTEELLNTNCQNIPLLYYCLEKLNGGYWPKTRIQDESKKLIKRYKNDPFFAEIEKQYIAFFGPVSNKKAQYLGPESKKILKASLEKAINEKKIFSQKLEALAKA